MKLRRLILPDEEKTYRKVMEFFKFYIYLFIYFFQEEEGGRVVSKCHSKATYIDSQNFLYAIHMV